MFPHDTCILFVRAPFLQVPAEVLPRVIHFYCNKHNEAADWPPVIIITNPPSPK